jgi:hypothetical protein
MITVQSSTSVINPLCSNSDLVLFTVISLSNHDAFVLKRTLKAFLAPRTLPLDSAVTIVRRSLDANLGHPPERGERFLNFANRAQDLLDWHNANGKKA